MVFCIHGNKWGVANCCEDFDIPETGGDKDSLVRVIMVILVPLTSLSLLQIHCESSEGDDDLLDTSSHCHTSREEGVDKR